LFDDEARAVIGRVGPATEGVRKMLTAVGFAPMDRVDPFDGGPHFEAKTDEIWPVTQTLRGKVAIVDKAVIVDSAGESADGLIAFEPDKRDRKKDGYFRCVHTEFRWNKSGKIVELHESAAKTLRVEDGDKVWALSFATHSRK
jgi:arginine N-succinyltransferase